MAKRTLKDAPPIRGLKREPRDTDASVTIGGATAVVKTAKSQEAKKKKSDKKPRKADTRLRVEIVNQEQFNALLAKFGITRPALINVALTHLAKKFLP